MINRERVLDRFIEYIQISSESKNEKVFSEKLTEDLEKIGLEVSRDNAGDIIGGTTGNIIAKLKGDESREPLLFSCHMDTVTPGINIKPIIKGNIIYSDGTTILGGDDKAGIAALIEALINVKEEKVNHPTIEVIFTIAEEIGLCGSKNLDYSKIESKRGFVLDTSGEVGTIVNKGPAQDKIDIIIKGKPAHAGVAPENGISAINVASKAIAAMNLLRIDEDTTANIGTIKGGTATNIVCPEVVIEAEARSTKIDKLDKQTKHMVDTFNKICDEENAECQIKVTRVYGQFVVDETDDIIKLASKSFENLGYNVEIKSSGGGSDTNILNCNGIKAVNLAIGERSPHTLDEHYHIYDLVKVSKSICEIIQNA
ncbi:M20/M25/M40 family metallo-hydrolase [Clostridium sardiniense]|uniref:M20/M25/M40 family metallo-hydrolase n=1 Tax=Clostridium sardiniense TaxID=29369 RepID=UPI00195E82F2|nr:M20/M25/M40 family metallo-hydrolase [Clostridium sardiniense]MBM7836759.1 tripeptide aminopeptidase [Clostridium sardiniense]